MVDLLEKNRIDVSPLLKPVTQTAPTEPWTLHAKLAFRDGHFWGVAKLPFFVPDGFFSGVAGLELRSAHYGSAVFETDFDGEVLNGKLLMHFCIIEKRFPRNHFQCDGGYVDAQTFSGTCKTCCLKPRTCNCGGLIEQFRLTRD